MDLHVAGVQRLWQCQQCGKLIRGKRSNLNQHLANKHELNRRPFACDMENCMKRFQTRLNLERHKCLVHAGRTVPCQFCTRAFKTEEKRLKHVESVHGEEKGFMCKFCGGCYRKEATLSRHIASVHRDSKDKEASDTDINTLSRRVASVHLDPKDKEVSATKASTDNKPPAP